MKIRAFCINLESHRDRKVHCENEYKKVPVTPEFFTAIDGRIQEVVADSITSDRKQQLHEEIDTNALSLGFFNRGMNSAERACAKSHLQVWRKILEIGTDSKQFYLVNEDDFIVLNARPLNSALEELRTLPYDFVYLGYRGGETLHRKNLNSLIQQIWHEIKWVCSDKTGVDRFRRNLVRFARPRLRKSSFYFFDAGMTWGGHAYLLNANAANELIAINEHLRFLPDEAFRYAILDERIIAGMSRIKMFGCNVDFGSSLRSESDHKRHHELFSSE
jgi:GR25 family glycosyltransferase involved in LPS biosynthesis